MRPERVTPTTTGPGQAWSAGHGPVRHTPLTRRRVSEMIAAPGEGVASPEGVIVPAAGS